MLNKEASTDQWAKLSSPASYPSSQTGVAMSHLMITQASLNIGLQSEY